MQFQRLDDDKLYNQKLIIYSVQQKKFFVQIKKTIEETQAKDKSPLKQKEILGIYYIPKTKEVLNQKFLQLEQIVIKKIQNCYQASRSFGLDKNMGLTVEQRHKEALTQILTLIQKTMGLIEKGKQGAQENEPFCFGLMKQLPSHLTSNIMQSTTRNQPQIQSCILTTYHPRLKIWHSYSLRKQDDIKENFFYNEATLALKANEKPENKVFILGGFQQKQLIGPNLLISSQEFYEASFPSSPYDESKQKALQVNKLPDLPYSCCLPMGVYDMGKTYLLGGVEWNDKEALMNSNVYFYDHKEKKWSDKKLTLPNKRVDGSIILDRKNKQVFLVGGFAIKPKNAQSNDSAQDYVSKVDILSLTMFKYLTFDLNYGLCDSKVMTNRCLITENASNILILGGRYLGKDYNSIILNLEQRKILDQEQRKEIKEFYLNKNQEFSEKSSFLLDRMGSVGLYQMNQIGAYTLLQDYEGVIVDDVFYTVYNRPSDVKLQFTNQSKVITAYMYELGTGKNMFIAYKDCADLIKKANSNKQPLVFCETIKRPFSSLRRIAFVE